MNARRIAVYGPSGSGKTTLAAEIGRRLDLPVIEFDALYHRPNWEPTPDDEFRAKVIACLEERTDGWVTDGNYKKVRDIVMGRAEAVVWLRLPFRVVYWRLVKRTIGRAWTKEPLWGTNYESWRLTFLSRDSILLWGISHWRAHHRGVQASLDEFHGGGADVVLRSPKEVEAFLGSLSRPAAS